MLGHKPREVILHVLKGARAPQQYIDAAKHFQCSACHEVKDEARTHPVGAPKDYAFNHEVSIDVFEIWDDS